MTPISVRLNKGYQTAIQIRQHTVMADELISDGGTDIAPTPMEIMAGAVGACVAVTTKAYAQRKGWPLEGVSIELDIERFKSADYAAYEGDAPFVHEIREAVRFEGPLSEEQLARLKEIAGKCPVHRVLENPVFFVEKEFEAEPKA
jgi:putative redox protein